MNLYRWKCFRFSPMNASASRRNIYSILALLVELVVDLGYFPRSRWMEWLYSMFSFAATRIASLPAFNSHRVFSFCTINIKHKQCPMRFPIVETQGERQCQDDWNSIESFVTLGDFQAVPMSDVQPKVGKDFDFPLQCQREYLRCNWVALTGSWFLIASYIKHLLTVIESGKPPGLRTSSVVVRVESATELRSKNLHVRISRKTRTQIESKFYFLPIPMRSFELLGLFSSPHHLLITVGVDGNL